MGVSNKFKKQIWLLALIVLALVAATACSNNDPETNDDKSIEVDKSDGEFTEEDESDFYYAANLIDIGKAEEALVVFQELAEKYPNHDRIQWQIGWAYAADENFQESLGYYQAAEELNPQLLENEAFIFQYSYSLMNLEDYAIAKTYLDRLDPEELAEDQLDLYLEWMEVIELNLN